VPGYYTGKATATGAPVAVFVSGSTVTVDAPGVPDICDPPPGTFSGPSSRFNLICNGTFNGSPGMLGWVATRRRGLRRFRARAMSVRRACAARLPSGPRAGQGRQPPRPPVARIAGTPAVAGSRLSVPLGCSRGACRVTVVARHETLLRRGEKRTVKVRLTKPGATGPGPRRAHPPVGHGRNERFTEGGGVTTRRVTLTRP
jgi:hypothetical protein